MDINKNSPIAAKLTSLVEQIGVVESEMEQLKESNSIYYCYGTTNSLNALSASLTVAKRELNTLLRNELSAQSSKVK